MNYLNQSDRSRWKTHRSWILEDGCRYGTIHHYHYFVRYHYGCRYYLPLNDILRLGISWVCVFIGRSRVCSRNTLLLNLPKLKTWNRAIWICIILFLCLLTPTSVNEMSKFRCLETRIVMVERESGDNCDVARCDVHRMQIGGKLNIDLSIGLCRCPDKLVFMQEHLINWIQKDEPFIRRYYNHNI